MIPTWALFGLGSALAGTAIPLLQERFKIHGYALAIWVKIFVILFSIPFVIKVGLPQEPKFYFWMACSGLLYAISDVVYYQSVPIVGSGVMTRLLPSSVVISFILWLFIDPSLLDKYLARPMQFGAIVAILICFVFFASSLKKCKVTSDAARMIWPVIFAAATGPTINKLGLGQAPEGQAAFAFLFVQGLFMITFWLAFLAARRHVPRNIMLSKEAIRAGAMIGGAMALAVYLLMTAMRLVDNPAFATVLYFTDSLWVMLIYKMTGRKETSNLWAGFGIVACAMMLVIVKSL